MLLLAYVVIVECVLLCCSAHVFLDVHVGMIYVLGVRPRCGRYPATQFGGGLCCKLVRLSSLHHALRLGSRWFNRVPCSPSLRSRGILNIWRALGVQHSPRGEAIWLARCTVVATWLGV